MKQHRSIMPSRTEGFSLVETLLVVVILAGVALGGAYLYHREHKESAPSPSTQNSTSAKASTNKSGTNSAGSSTTDPYAGWKTASLKYESLTLKYPSNWNLTATSTPDGLTGTVSPGSDQVTLASSDGLTVTINTGVTGIGDGPGAGIDSFVSAQPISTLGGTYYLDVYRSACVGTLSTVDANWPVSKNIKTTDGSGDQPFDVICVKSSSSEDGSPDAINSDPSFSDAKLIIESLAY